MSNLIDWNPVTHPFHKMLQIGDVIAAASATFFRETCFIAQNALNGVKTDKDSEGSESALDQSRKKYCEVRDSVLSLMPEGNRHPHYFSRDLYRDCLRYCAIRSKQEPNDLAFCVCTVFDMFELQLRFGSGESDVDTLKTYSQDGRAKIVTMLAQIGEPKLPGQIDTRDLKFRSWITSQLPTGAELDDWITAMREPDEAQATPSKKPVGGQATVVPDKPVGKPTGGRPGLGKGKKQSENEKALHNLYMIIQNAGVKLTAGTLMDHFKSDKDFRDKVKEAGKKYKEALFINAISWIKYQKTSSENVS